MGYSAGMTSLSRLPFNDQIATLLRRLDEGHSRAALLDETGSLIDPEPLSWLLIELQHRGILGADIVPALEVIARSLPDPSLQHVLQRATGHADCTARLLEVAGIALRWWPLERVNALALLSRWLRLRDPAAYGALEDEARRVVDSLRASPPAVVEPCRWLLFLSGAELAGLGQTESMRAVVEVTATFALDQLARAPKSLSQANAEELLSRRVYADPGHFIFELLQNADDAGARRWEARFEPGRVVVIHDGAPFSFRDAIGVLSIGQTTKDAGQIGFFGVGFKSVYGVTERPRIHSGALHFEIAHVSIPRVLHTRPPEADDGQTVVVLPFRDDMASTAQDLFERARAIPPETLMTLPNLCELEIVGPDGQRRHERAEHSGNETVLVDLVGGGRRRFLREMGSVRFDGPRPEGRSTSSPLMVAAEIRSHDDIETAAPLVGATVFAFLPTAEDSGLRVLTHARYDVTVDRERLEGDSPWNRCLLAAGGAALGALAGALALRGIDPLPVLPATDELSNGVAEVGKAVRATLLDLPVLRAANGELVSPRLARLLPDDLLTQLAPLDLGAGARALGPLTLRDRSAARFLGARELLATELLAALSAELSTGRVPPPWLGSAVYAALDRGVSEGSLTADALRSVALLVDSSGTCCAAGNACSAPTRWATLYAATPQSVVSDDSVDRLPKQLKHALNLARLDGARLVRDLHTPNLGPLLASQTAPLLVVLSDLSDHDLANLADVPLWRDRDGRLVSTSQGLVRLSPRIEPLAGSALLSSHALLDPGPYAGAAELLSRVLPELDLDRLATRLVEDSSLFLDAGTAVILTHILDAHSSELSAELARRWAGVATFADVHGVLRALHGSAAVVLAEDDVLRDALPNWPWLVTEGADSGRFARAWGIEHIGPSDVSRALGSGDATRTVSPQCMPAVYAWLAARADRLTQRALATLQSASAWLDESGTPRTLNELRRGVTSAALDALLAQIGSRAIAHEATLAFADALGFGHRVPLSDHRALVAALTEHGVPHDIDGALLLFALVEAVDHVPSQELCRLSALALVRDTSGIRRRLARLDHLDDVGAALRAAAHGRAPAIRPGRFRSVLEAGPLPLVHPDDALHAAVLMDSLGVVLAEPSDLVRLAACDAALTTPPAGLRSALVTHAGLLDVEAQALLLELPLFEAVDGTASPAGRLAPRSALEGYLSPEVIDALGVNSRLLPAAQESAARALGLPTGDVAELLRELVLPLLVADAPLAQQRAPFASRQALAGLARLCAAAGLGPDAAPVSLSTTGLVVLGPLYRIDDVQSRLLESLAGRRRAMDPAFAAELGDALAVMTRPLPARVIAEGLRQRFPEPPAVSLKSRPEPDSQLDFEALYAWITDEEETLAHDQAARSALGRAAVIPSAQGPLRAPRALLLDPSLPDVGLELGPAESVPPRVRGVLTRLFEVEQEQRRIVIEALLHALDTCVQADDATRAVELCDVLGALIGVDGEASALADRTARSTKTRARLRVRTADGDWEKPRRLWVGEDEELHALEGFLKSPPPRVRMPGLTPRGLALLIVCGAHRQVDSKLLASALDGDGLSLAPDARSRLARYLLMRAAGDAGLVEELGLRKRPWVPDRAGGYRRPTELLWPTEATCSIVGETQGSLVDASASRGLTAESVTALGFRGRDRITLSDLADVGSPRAVPEAMVEWLEVELSARRLTKQAVRDALRERVLLRDDRGVLRPPWRLACRGADELFGPLAGDLALGQRLNRATRALGVSASPDVTMILGVISELSADDGLSIQQTEALVRALPECYRRLGRAAEKGREIALRPSFVVACLTERGTALRRLGSTDVAMVAPGGVADALGDELIAGLVDPLPSYDRTDALRRVLLQAGVPDLWSLLTVTGVSPGPAVPSRRGQADALHATLRQALGDAVGLSARAVTSLGVSVTLQTGGVGTVAADAAVFEGVLWLSEQALDDHRLLAPVLAPSPARRVPMLQWLDTVAVGAPADLDKPTHQPKRSPPKQAGRGVFERLRGWLGGNPEAKTDEEPNEVTPRPADDPVGQDFFRPSEQVSSQLEGRENWVQDRRLRPDFGFAFTPPDLPAPWTYAPRVVAVTFERGRQRFVAARLDPPQSVGHEGLVVLRGRLPSGEAVLPVPHFGRIETLEIDGEPATPSVDAFGRPVLYLRAAAQITMRIALGRASGLDTAVIDELLEGAGTAAFVPDHELPEPVHVFLREVDQQLDAADGLGVVDAIHRVRDFVRQRYRYDPAYLEQPEVARWLARRVEGRAHAHVAALHAGADAKHLGAGVCYELNSLTCELLRRLGIPAGIATGWVFTGGAVSEPDHLWVVAFLRDAAGRPLWLPVDASSTRSGRPLRVSSRPPGRFRPPADREAKRPVSPRDDLNPPPRRGQPTGQSKPRKATRRSLRKRTRKVVVPRAELLRLLRYLERRAGHELTEDELEALRQALDDPHLATQLLNRMREPT